MRNDIPNMAEEFFSLAKHYEEEVHDHLPRVIGIKVAKHFSDNIENQGMGGELFKELGESRRKTRISQMGPGADKPVLIWTGNGQREVENSYRKPEITESSIVIPFEVSDETKYMAFHNEGQGNNPKREFTGTNEEVDEIVDNSIIDMFENVGLNLNYNEL